MRDFILNLNNIEIMIFIFCSQWLIFNILVNTMARLYCKFVTVEFEDLDSMSYRKVLFWMFTPILNIVTFILFFEEKEFRQWLWKKIRFKKTLIILPFLFLSINTFSQTEYRPYYRDINFTYSPSKLGLGIVHTQGDLIVAFEYSKPQVLTHTSELYYCKFGTGMRVWKWNYKELGKHWEISLNSLLMYNEANQLFLEYYKKERVSLEVGFTSTIEGNTTCCFYIDVINGDAKFGMGFKF